MKKHDIPIGKVRFVTERVEITPETRRLLARKLKPAELAGATHFTVEHATAANPYDKGSVRELIDAIRDNPNHAFNDPEDAGHGAAVANVQSLYRLLQE